MGGEQYVVREWKKAEIAGVVKDGSAISPQDPFKEIDNPSAISANRQCRVLFSSVINGKLHVVVMVVVVVAT